MDDDEQTWSPKPTTGNKGTVSKEAGCVIGVALMDGGSGLGMIYLNVPIQATDKTAFCMLTWNKLPNNTLTNKVPYFSLLP